jgi:predicted TIM-barrel fold metal-dependent hydrolase
MQEPLGSALSGSHCASTLDRCAIWDCHFKIGGTHSSISTAQPPNLAGEVAIYREMAKRIGASRGVVVQATAHGTDNRYTLEALAALGDGYRAVVSIDEPVDIRTLRRWHALGVRGVRFDQLRAKDMLPVLTKHSACLGWHVELSMELRALRGCERMLRSLPVPVVLEYLARTAPGDKGGRAALLRLSSQRIFGSSCCLPLPALTTCGWMMR